MLRADSSQFTLGKPLVSVDALRQLRDLLSILQASAGCGKASLKIMPKEGIDETAEAQRNCYYRTCSRIGLQRIYRRTDKETSQAHWRNFS